MKAGAHNRASIAILTSFASIFLPRYSGVRPIISPAANTATKTNSRMPKRPEPGPPTMISSTIILAISTSPESGMKLSCIESTAPSEEAVDTSAKSEDCATPKRTSLPSMLPPARLTPNAAKAWFGVASFL